MKTLPLNSDIHYVSASAYRPTSFSIPIEQAMAARWLELAPWVALTTRRTSDPVASFYLYKTKHRERLTRLLLARIAWPSIRRANADDPLLDDFTFEQKFKEASARRQERMGRVKGKGRHPGRKRT